LNGLNKLLSLYCLGFRNYCREIKSIRFADIGLLVAIFILLYGCGPKNEIRVEYVNALQISDIVPVTDSLVIPVDYRTVVPLDSLGVDERKQKFIDILLPSILITKFNLNTLHERINEIAQIDSAEMDHDDRQLVDSLLIKYRAKDIVDLLEKLETHPASIALAQAALESAWGTSRFFYEGNNPFGIWSFFEDEPRIASLIPRDGTQVFLKKYKSISGSVESYFRVIATGPYAKFREHRLKTKKPQKLVPYLHNYSEMSTVYVDMVEDIIRQNNLNRYDVYKIDPDYIR